MTDAQPAPPPAERKIAVDAFNLVWTLLEKTDRTDLETDRMIHAAHASRFHWEQVGTAVNLARGEWQCSRVYAVLGMAESALHHARRTLEICEENGIADFDVAYAYEALARAHAAAGSREDSSRYWDLAAGAAAGIAEKDDRDYFAQDLAKEPWYGCRDEG